VERHRFVLRATIQHWPNDKDMRTVLFELVDWVNTALGAVIDRGQPEGAIGSGPAAQQLAATLIWSAARARRASHLLMAARTASSPFWPSASAGARRFL